jgi:uncharacterized Zn-finger protein
MWTSSNPPGQAIFHNDNIVIQGSDEFATYIKYRYSLKTFCEKCNKPFASAIDLKMHKRQIHSY